MRGWCQISRGLTSALVTVVAAMMLAPIPALSAGLPNQTGSGDQVYARAHVKHKAHVRNLPTASAEKERIIKPRHVGPKVEAPEGPKAAVSGSRTGGALVRKGTSAATVGNGSGPLVGTSTGSSAVPVGGVSRVDPALEQLTEFTGDGFDNVTPPDTQLAVGPFRVIEMVNRTGHVWDKAGNSISTFNLSTFFGAPVIAMGRASYSDPRVLYDTSSGRFFASILIFDGCDSRQPPVGTGCTTRANSEVDAAVSDTSDPAGGWTVYTIETNTANVLFDQPKLGNADDKLVMTYNENGFGGPYRFVVLQKSDMVAAAASVRLTFFALDNSHYNVIPVQSLSSTSTEYAVSANQGSGTLSVFAFTGTPASGNVARSITNLGIGTINDPPSADQQGDPRQLDTGTSGVQSAVWDNNNLWAAGNTKCRPANDTADRSCLRLNQVSTAGTPSLQQDVNLGQTGAHLFYPAVTLDISGNLWIGHSVSSTSQFPTAGITFVAGGAFPPTVPGVDYAIGSGPYNCTFCTAQNGDTRDRWGDYSGAVRDPSNPKDVWFAEEFGSTSSTNTDLWGTGIARFTFAGPTVTAISPASGPERPENPACNPTVVVTGTDFVPSATSVAFGSVASSSVNVTSPERLTAVAPSQAAGTVDVKVTTAAGTSATSAADQFTYVADTTPPTTTALVNPPPNSAGWNRTNATVTLNATDNTCGTGVASLSYSATGAQPISLTTVNSASAAITITAEGTTTISYRASDRAGNVEAQRTLTVKLDRTPPVITGSQSPAANAAGWNNTNVTVSFICSDAVSGVASCSAPTVLTTEGVNQSVTGTALDNAGNSSSATVSGIKIDKTPPVVTFSGNAGTYTVADTVNITCAASDNLSGVASTTNCSPITGPAYTFGLGAHTFTATATDVAGNVGTASTTFTVVVTAASLSTLTARFVTKPGVANSLAAKLRAAQAAADRGDLQAKAGAIRAYINEVQAQSGKSLTPAQAAILIQLAMAL